MPTMTISASLSNVWRALREPVLAESRALLRANWAQLPESLRTPHQMLGRQGNGCGATIGAMPRCDFACRGCYLGEEANRIPAQPVDEIKAQMRALRPALGPAGNLQFTDGEVTLRPADEVIELLRYARSLDVIPMLMTHGDSFRRRPGLLERLMVEGGLTELSIHVDTTQRGRVGDAYRRATREAELNPLRAEFAALLARARATTGRPIRAATTMTITPGNIGGVADVARWLVDHPDAFFMVSFQPIAQVGRTEAGLGDSVDVEQVWREIARGVYGDGPAATERLLAGQEWLGHSACNRFVHGIATTRAGQPATFHPVRAHDDPADTRPVDGFLRRFGGFSTRRDAPLIAGARLAGLVMRDPLFFARSVPPFAWHWLRRIAPDAPLRAAVDIISGRRRVHGFLFVSHHFMSKAQIETPLGRERLAQCVFHVPVNGKLVSMCEVNALGVREQYYAQITAPRASDRRVATATPSS